MQRTIFHVDMDAFYAAVEQRDCPNHRGSPVIVGADPKGGQGRGVVAACSYQARRFGIHSAMAISKAFRLCPKGVYLRPDFKKYTEVSLEIRTTLRGFTDRIEPLSIDEAFLDVSDVAADEQRAVGMAHDLKQEILRAQRLSCSVGIAPNKFVAKIASDLEKPDGLVLVRPNEVQSFLDPLPISRLWGVGPRTEARLATMGVKTILQLRHFEKTRLVHALGKQGEHLWRLSNGIDERPVVERQAPKSIGHERTFPEDVLDGRILQETLQRLSESVAERLQKRVLSGRRVTLKLRYADFTTTTRQITLAEAVDVGADIQAIALKLLHRFRDPDQKIRLIGVSVSSLTSRGGLISRRQLSLFS